MNTRDCENKELSTAAILILQNSATPRISDNAGTTNSSNERNRIAPGLEKIWDVLGYKERGHPDRPQDKLLVRLQIGPSVRRHLVARPESVPVAPPLPTIWKADSRKPKSIRGQNPPP